MAEAKFPIQYTERTVSGRGPSVRANIDVRTGAGAIGQAVGELGGAVFEIGQRFYAMESKTQSDDAEMNAAFSMTQFLQEARKEDDVSKWETLYRQHEERVNSLTPEHRGAATRYKAAIKRRVPHWREIFVSMREKKFEDNMIAASITKVDGLKKAVTLGTMDLVAQEIRKELYLRDKLSYSISRSDTEILVASVGHDVQMSAAENMAMTKPDELLSRIKGATVEGFNEITTAADIQRVRSIANHTIGLTLKELRKQQEQEEQNIEKAINENKLDVDSMISDSSISADDKWKWRQRAKSEAEEISDPDTVWRVWDDLDKAVRDYQLAPTEGKRLELQKTLKSKRFDERTLSQKEYVSLTAGLETPIAKEDAYWLGEARDLLEEAIRERDKFSGMLKTNEALIARAAMAKMQLDKEIEEAAAAGKPIRGRDLMMTAMRLVPHFKPSQKLTTKESKKWPNVPETFKEPEIEFDWGEPSSLDEFYENVRNLYESSEYEEWLFPEDTARAYYDMWIDTFEAEK